MKHDIPEEQKRKYGWVIKILYLLYVAAVLFLCLFNFSQIPDLELPSHFLGIRMDRYAHALMFMPYPLMALLTCQCSRHLKRFRPYALWIAIITGLCFALGTELLQEWLTDNREGDPLDLVADLTGLLVGTLITVAIKFKHNTMKRLLLFWLVALFLTPAPAEAHRRNNREELPAELFQPVADSIQAYLKDKAVIYGSIKVDQAVRVNKKELLLYCNTYLAEYPIRDHDVKAIYALAKDLLPEAYRKDRLVIYSGKVKNNQVATLEQLSSPYYSGKSILNSEPPRRGTAATAQWVRPESRPYTISAGLDNRHIAIWQSHGFYYEQSLLRWEWQRARILQTVEDLYTQSYVLPFLVPMLENAGATVALPRERDNNTTEIIVDNDGNLFSEKSRYQERQGSGKATWTSLSTGFAHTQAIYTQGQNPFTMGSARVIETVKENQGNTVSEAAWIPAIEKPGQYAVYVSYRSLPSSTDCARYVVRHDGGETAFLVNQQMGGGTWVYLGTFYFSQQEASSQRQQGVYLSNATPAGHKYTKKQVVSADAVKFGGGMGNIGRTPNNWNADSLFALDPQISGYPRYTEGARYWLQWAGFSDTVYSYTENKNDYTDDYMSRGIWVNALSGGSNVNPKTEGLKVPIDLSVAFHTDAGTTLDDEMVGTLAIYTRYKNNQDKFPTGEPRIVSRELTDLIQTQICEDVKAEFDQEWPRRGLWDKSYAESRIPDVPAMLLELLSHQNFADMRYGLDPKFRFTVSRAIYKGILRFISLRDGVPYVVQPLPVTAFGADVEYGPNGPVAHLSWVPQSDPLEPTAEARQYMIYTAVTTPGQPLGGYDNGILVNEPFARIGLETGKIYSFKVVPINDGGAGFPSETLSVGLTENYNYDNTVMIINGFDRISAPANFATRDSSRAGFLNYLDGGVSYINDYSFIGRQHDYRRHIPWMDDDSPGFGASYGNYEDKVIAGNSFDFPFRHGTALMQAGYSFTSASRDAVTRNRHINKYAAIDLILGKQVTIDEGRPAIAKPRYEAFPIALRQVLTDYCLQGGHVLVSGAYVGTDLWDTLNQFPKTESKKESDQLNDLVREINRMSGSLDQILNDMQDRLADNQNRNENMAIEYFVTDTTGYTQSQNLYNRSREWMDSIRTNLKAAVKLAQDLEHQSDARMMGQDFARNTLKYRWMTNFASAEGAICGAPNPYGFQIDSRFEFCTQPNAETYAVESPDGIMPVGDHAWTIFRYADNNISAGVAYGGEDYRTVVFGFPLETLKTQQQLNDLMQQVMNFLLPR